MDAEQVVADCLGDEPDVWTNLEVDEDSRSWRSVYCGVVDSLALGIRSLVVSRMEREVCEKHSWVWSVQYEGEVEMCSLCTLAGVATGVEDKFLRWVAAWGMRDVDFFASCPMDIRLNFIVLTTVMVYGASCRSPSLLAPRE